jgi:hypothetical protein
MTADYPSFDEFWAKVQDTWDQQWAAVFGADWQGDGMVQLCHVKLARP